MHILEIIWHLAVSGAPSAAWARTSRDCARGAGEGGCRGGDRGQQERPRAEVPAGPGRPVADRIVVNLRHDGDRF